MAEPTDRQGSDEAQELPMTVRLMDLGRIARSSRVLALIESAVGVEPVVHRDAREARQDPRIVHRDAAASLVNAQMRELVGGRHMPPVQASLDPAPGLIDMQQLASGELISDQLHTWRDSAAEAIDARHDPPD